MSTGASRVLFDAPGPAARRRARIISVIVILVLVALIAGALAQLNKHDQLAWWRWQAFLTKPYLRVLWQGLYGTLEATGMSALLAFPIGALLALGRLSTHRALSWISTVYIEVFRSVPLLLLMYAFLLGLPRYGVNFPIFWKLVIPIVMIGAASIAEVVRAGVLALDRGQTEAAYAIGLRRGQAMRLVVLPQAFRMMVPLLIAQLVTVLMNTSLGFAVSFPELMQQGDFLTARTHLLLQTYLIIAVVYIAINYLLGQVAALVERRLGRRPGSSTRLKVRTGVPAAFFGSGPTAVVDAGEAAE